MRCSSKIYNNLHLTNLPFDTLNKREKIYRKRITEAYFTFICLEYSQRKGVRNPVITDLNETIVENTEFFKESLRSGSSDHKCDIPGCSKVLVIDGDCKKHRKLHFF